MPTPRARNGSVLESLVRCAGKLALVLYSGRRSSRVIVTSSILKGRPAGYPDVDPAALGRTKGTGAALLVARSFRIASWSTGLENR